MSLPALSTTYGQGAGLSPRVARVLGRDLATIQAGLAVDVARIDAAVQRRETVTEGITAITGRALQHVALVSQAEQQLAMTTPAASGRLAAVADAHALAMTGIVMETARALGRLV